MISPCVLDASAAAAVVFREPDAQSVLPCLLGRSAVVVPQIFGLELANVGRVKVLRGELGWGPAEELLQDAMGWPLEVVSVDWQRAWTVAREHGLTVYDAAYLALALSRTLPLLTLDAQLASAAGSLALPKGRTGGRR